MLYSHGPASKSDIIMQLYDKIRRDNWTLALRFSVQITWMHWELPVLWCRGLTVQAGYLSTRLTSETIRGYKRNIRIIILRQYYIRLAIQALDIEQRCISMPEIPQG